MIVDLGSAADVRTTVTAPRSPRFTTLKLSPLNERYSISTMTPERRIWAHRLGASQTNEIKTGNVNSNLSMAPQKWYHSPGLRVRTPGTD